MKNNNCFKGNDGCCLLFYLLNHGVTWKAHRHEMIDDRSRVIWVGVQGNNKVWKVWDENRQLLSEVLKTYAHH